MSVRVRYAPSPTGLQHIGSVRTALFNYLFARSMGGTFLLRIEDTDQGRSTPEGVQDLYDTYAWLGFHWDEGPDVGGPKGPYVQSERADLYRRYAEELVEKGAAYRCWCTPERLSKLREEQAAAKSSTTGYDRHCRAITDAERREAEARGIKPVIRLKIPLEESTTFHDEILGDVTQPNKDINPDPVLLKSDGFPTYHLANVVDDHLMGITHILRAQEWVASVPLHVNLYRAFGWEPPKFCHLPMVLGSDGHKLSKRHGSTAVREFREKGYLPEAVINYLALLGWSYDGSTEVFGLRELEKAFRLERLNKAPAVFDYQKLDWFNGTYIRALSPKELAGRLVPFMKKAGFTGDAVEEGRLAAVAPLVRERLKVLSEAPAMVRYLFEEPAEYRIEDAIPKKMDAARAASLLRAADALLPSVEGKEPAEAEKAFRDLAEKEGVKLGELMTPLRAAVTGSKVSPPLFESIAILGTAKARARAARLIALLEGSR